MKSKMRWELMRRLTRQSCIRYKTKKINTIYRDRDSEECASGGH